MRSKRPPITNYQLPITVVFLLLAFTLRAFAQSSAATKPSILADVTIQQKLGDTLPQDITLTDETGKPITLGQLQTGRPVVLTLVYFGCPSLCTVVLNETLSTLDVMPLRLGKDYDVWTVSFDPRETAALARAKKEQYVHTYNHTKALPLDDPAAGMNWHFLTGDAENIHRLTDAVGFRYKWDEPSKQFFHPAGIAILSPEATVSRYFFGVHYDVTDVRLALVAAGHGKVGGLTDTILLFCYHYDPATGRYSLSILRILEVLSAVTVVTIAGALAYLFHIDRRRTRALMPAARTAPAAGGSP